MVIGTLILLTGCANVGTMQADCESRYDKFVEIFTCTKSTVAADRRLKNHPKSKLYFLRGEQLVEKVKAGQMTELDARAEWQQLFVELKHNEDMENSAKSAAAAATRNATKVKQTNCVPVGNSVQCTTY